MDDKQTELTAKNVHEIFIGCLFKPEELKNGTAEHVEVRGIRLRVGFHPDRLENVRADVQSMLIQLSDDFRAYGGGGMSFLAACVRKDGVHWAEHKTMDELFMLGIGLKLVEWLGMDKLSDMPGGMPYVVIHIPL